MSTSLITERRKRSNFDGNYFLKTVRVSVGYLGTHGNSNLVSSPEWPWTEKHRGWIKFWTFDHVLWTNKMTKSFPNYDATFKINANFPQPRISIIPQLLVGYQYFVHFFHTDFPYVPVRIFWQTWLISGLAIYENYRHTRILVFHDFSR